MANQVIPRLTGDDYQHLYGWWKALLLLKESENVSHVRVEDIEGGSVDDVTVYRNLGADAGDEFYHYFFQIKYHANYSSHYGVDNLLEHKPHGTSLLQKFHNTWRSLKEHRPQEPVLLHLVSNWFWSGSDDDLGAFVSGNDDRITDQFFTLGARSKGGQLRVRLQTHLGIDDAEFAAFTRSIRFQLGSGCWKEIRDRVAERMDNLGLKHDEAALVACSGIVRNWIIEKKGDITKEVLEKILTDNRLREGQREKVGTTIYLITIQKRVFQLNPDYVLDWREFFEGIENRKGHKIRRQADWDETLMPQLLALEGQVSQRTSKLIRARGLARLSAWFGFGYAFSTVAGYVIEVEQSEERHWRSDASPSEFAMKVSTETELKSLDATRFANVTVACGISVTGDLKEDVLRDLEQRARVKAALFLEPNQGLGANTFRIAEDVGAFVDSSKRMIREFVKRHRAQELLLYYFGPLSGACFLGQQLNAICSTIVVMEDQQPGYAPAFRLQF
jgi:SMODS-associated and fused to various effectors sensor domain